MAVLVLICQIFWSFIGIFAACEFASLQSQAFDDINGKLNALDWYEYPIELWQMLPILIAAAQQPVGICIIGSIFCNRVTFKKVGRIEMRLNSK